MTSSWAAATDKAGEKALLPATTLEQRSTTPFSPALSEETTKEEEKGLGLSERPVVNGVVGAAEDKEETRVGEI